MIAKTDIQALKQLLCDEIEIERKGLDEYEVYTPFMFDDGDHYVCVVRHIGDSWQITDQGHTFMHMSYEMQEFLTGRREKVVEETLGIHGMEFRDGVITLQTPKDLLAHGIYSFVQAIAKITNVTKFTREVIQTTFFEDFNRTMIEIAGACNLQFEWYDKSHDVDHLYRVDCYLEGRGNDPWMVFAVNNRDKCNMATISCLKIEQYLPRSRSIAIFESQADLDSKSVARLTDVSYKTFSSLGDKERIRKYFEREVIPSQNI